MALKHLGYGIVIACAIGFAGCSENEESDRFDVVITTAPLSVPFTNSLGYEVWIHQADFLVETTYFTREGEVHLAKRWLPSLPSAFAHPGHTQGGEIVGETQGIHLITFNHESNLVAEATLLRGAIEAGDITLRNRAEDDEIDRLPVGASIRLVGSAFRGDQAWPFDLSFGHSERTTIIGIPVETILPTGQSLQMHFDTVIYGENAEASIFDNIDFAADTETVQNGDVVFSTATTNRIRRVLNRHDWFRFTLQ